MPLTKVQAGMVEATGTASSSTFLRGDGAWAGTITSGTAVTASGTSVDFNSIPAGVKRITVMFSAVSTNGTSNPLIQIGSGSITTSGYVSTGGNAINNASPQVGSSTAGFLLGEISLSTALLSGTIVITNISGNSWVSNSFGKYLTDRCFFGGGNVTLSGTLDRVRITTVNGTDTFDAGTINIMYET